MASVDHKLFRELKNKYPEIPDNVVTSCMTKVCNDRIKCMELLSQESPKYLFGRPSHTVNDSYPHFGDGDVRPRSDSSGSNMSNASAGSASSRPTFHTSHSFSNTPGYRGPITISDDGSPPVSAPVRPSDLNQFITFHGEDRTSNIPHINCNNNIRAGYGQGFGHLPSGNSPTQPTKPGLRPIEVQHIQSSMDHAENQSQPLSYTYQIRIDRGQGSLGHNPLPVMPDRWNYHPIKPNPNPNFHNNPQITAFSSDLHVLPSQFENININPHATPSYKSPTEEYNNQSLGASKNNHSSQTQIYLHPVLSPGPQTKLKSPITDRTIHSPLPGPYSFNSSGISDQRNSPSFMRIKPVTEKAHELPSPQNPQGVGRPIVVEIKSARREGGVQSHIQYFNEIANSSNSSGHTTPVPHGSVIGPNGQPSENLVTGDHQGQTVINIKGLSPSHEEGGFLKFPPMSNVCRVPGHPPGHVHMGGSDSDAYFRGERDYRQNSRPFISPASSHSSLSSESSPALNNNQPQPGPLIMDDGEEYIQVLLLHQKSRMQKLTEDLSAADDRLKQLRGEVSHLQYSSVDRKRKRTLPFPSLIDLTKLRGENLQLQADIQLMTREIDMYNNGQTPLGVLDPLEEQNFYNFTNTGQRGSIYASSGEPHPKVFTSTVTTSVTPVTTSVTPDTTSMNPTGLSQPHRPPREIPALPTTAPPSLPPRDKKVEPPPPLPPRNVATTHVPPPPPHQPQAGSGDSDADGEQWSCSACTFLNHPALNKCECCEMPRMNFSSLSSPRDEPDS